MSQKDLFHNLGVQQLLASVLTAPTIDLDSPSVDLQGKRSVMLLVGVGNSLDTLSGSVYIELELEESDDNITFTDVADADMRDPVTGNNTGTFAVINAPTEDTLTFVAGYYGSKRYVRVVVNVTGTHTNGTPLYIAALFEPLALPAR